MLFPKKPSANLESRHLGLIPVREQKDLHNKIRQISKEISDYLDFALIEKICKTTFSLDKIKVVKTKKIKSLNCYCS